MPFGANGTMASRAVCSEQPGRPAEVRSVSCGSLKPNTSTPVEAVVGTPVQVSCQSLPSRGRDVAFSTRPPQPAPSVRLPAIAPLLPS